ncbi:MAG TPA: class I SAM-dependent methyltransferase [Acidiferrobacterales bacterium]|nr:class I SAM-dependent methyltransferase [Acidiferrobacterales bacterium]
MDRIPEAEVMDDPEQARAYALADFSQPHQAFVNHFKQCFAHHRVARVLDLGCGPADITIRFAKAYPECEIVGVDASEAMLAFGRTALAAEGLRPRVRLIRARLPLAFPHAVLPQTEFDTVISNSLLHHLANPMVLWRTIKALAAKRAAIFVMDLARPASRAEAEALVENYAAAEPAILKRDFLNSLFAAYRLEEIQQQLRQAGLPYLQTQFVSDRHIIAFGRFCRET